MSTTEMSGREVLQEVTSNRQETTTGTIRRKALPTANSFDSTTTLSQRVDTLSLSTTIDSQAETSLVGSPITPLFSAASGDEFLGFAPGTAEEAALEGGVPAKTSKFKSAVEEARHFAGGLVSHPYESTKHHTILRHSHGLVYFQGFATNIAVTVFADQDLPADRQFWLQKRGFSGSTGLKVGAMLGSKSAWINVTPTVNATPDQLPPADERAWQRDIEKFLRKAPKDLRQQTPRETDILRIPFEAQDGYFRIMLCTGEKGKKVVCPSPVFRLASTSTSSSSIRGASLSTLPLELSLKIGQYAAKTAALSAAQPLVSGVTGSLKQMLPYQPSKLMDSAAEAAYSALPTPPQANTQYQQARAATTAMISSELARPDTVGGDDASGPVAPFPIRFAAKVTPGTGASRARLGMPTANLSGLPEEVRLSLSGVYAGWVSVGSAAGKAPSSLPADLVEPWHPAIVTIAPLAGTTATVVRAQDARVYLLADFGDYTFVGATLDVLLMAPLRALQPDSIQGGDVEAQLVTIARDVEITRASLVERPEWGAEETLARMDRVRKGRGIAQRVGDARRAGQKQVDRVLPLHLVGVRTESLGVRDRLVGNGGVWVRR